MNKEPITLMEAAPSQQHFDALYWPWENYAKPSREQWVLAQVVMKQAKHLLALAHAAGLEVNITRKPGEKRMGGHGMSVDVYPRRLES